MAEHTIDLPARYEKALNAAADMAGVEDSAMLVELAKNALEIYISAELADTSEKLKKVYVTDPAKFADMQVTIDTEYQAIVAKETLARKEKNK